MTITTYAPGEGPFAPRNDSPATQAHRARAAQELARWQGRSDFSRAECGQIAEGLRNWGVHWPEAERARLQRLADNPPVMFGSPPPPAPAPEPAPAPGLVASALRRLADRIDGGDATAARAIIRAADS